MDIERTAAARAHVAGCLLRIRSLYRSMAKVHKRIADRILENPQQTIRLPVTELASMADASEASVVLFCKKLGFRGYHDLKITLAEEIYNSSADIHEEIERGDETPTIVKKVFNTSIQALTDSLKVLDVEAVDQAATSILAAKKISVIGVGISGLIAKDLWMKLFRMGLNANYYDNEWSIRMAGVLAQQGDVIVAISHSGSTTAVVERLGGGSSSGREDDRPDELPELTTHAPDRPAAAHLLARDRSPRGGDDLADRAAGGRRFAVRRNLEQIL